MNDSARLLRLEDGAGQRGDRPRGRPWARSRRVIRRNYAGFASRRPMGSFLFLGPTGVGKTELARALADVLFGSRDALVRLDMSELSEAHGVSRLIGAPAGLRRLRRRRPAHRAGAPAPLVGGGARRDREGAPRGADAAAPGARGGPAHRRQGPPHRLLEHGGGAHHEPRRRGVRPHEGAGVGFGGATRAGPRAASTRRALGDARRCLPSCGTASTSAACSGRCRRWRSRRIATLLLDESSQRPRRRRRASSTSPATTW